MRIAHICQSYPPMVSGAAQMVQRMAAGLDERGHQVLVLAASDRGGAYRQTIGDVSVVRLRALYNPFRARQRFVALPGHALQAELRAFQPDVLHLHDPLGMGLPGLRAAERLGLPAILTLHVLPVMVSAYAPPLPGLRRLVEAAAWRFGGAFASRCQALAAPSESVAAEVQIRAGLRSRLIPDGVDMQQFTCQPAHTAEADVLRRKYRLDPALPVILHVGRLDTGKNVSIVLEAAAAAMRQTAAQLLVVGDGTQRQALAALSIRLGIAERTHFTGFVSRQDDLPGLYRLASVFVTASVVETEGIAVVEAVVSGLPVAAVRATSIPSLVEDAQTGWLAAPGNSADLAAARMTLLGDPARARAMGAAGRAKLVSTHSFSTTLTRYEQLYAELAERCRQPRAEVLRN